MKVGSGMQSAMRRNSNANARARSYREVHTPSQPCSCPHSKSMPRAQHGACSVSKALAWMGLLRCTKCLRLYQKLPEVKLLRWYAVCFATSLSRRSAQRITFLLAALQWCHPRANLCVRGRASGKVRGGSNSVMHHSDPK